MRRGGQAFASSLQLLAFVRVTTCRHQSKGFGTPCDEGDKPTSEELLHINPANFVNDGVSKVQVFKAPSPPLDGLLSCLIESTCAIRGHLQRTPDPCLLCGAVRGRFSSGLPPAVEHIFTCPALPPTLATYADLWTAPPLAMQRYWEYLTAIRQPHQTSTNI